jgi:hypothetical protein
MRTASFAFVALAALVGTRVPLEAAPVARPSAVPDSSIVNVRMQCDRLRCWDTQTGAYTGSFCDRNGCRPNTGVLGYLNRPPSPAPTYGRGYGGPRRYEDSYERPRYRERRGWRREWEYD